ncbi:MAG: hypothetical protein M3P98_01205 [bacterium]|nr:hypothetical protein [bacterium]
MKSKSDSYLFQTVNGKKKFRYTICVSGAAHGPTVEKSAKDAEEIGREIARRGHILTTGATVGLPFHAALGAKAEGGMSIGFSPANSLKGHLRKYRLPFEPFDFINFTGLDYSGRDLYLVQSSDAVITIGGRFGSLHEFTSALEAGKPTGILLGSGGTADIVPQLIEVLDPHMRKFVIYESDPKTLVDRIEQVLEEEFKDLHKEFAEGDTSWYAQRYGKKKKG